MCVCLSVCRTITERKNAAARLIFWLGTREHVTVNLLQLHWLPVRWRVQFSLCCLMHAIFCGKFPGYPDNFVSHVDCSRPRCGLRTSSLPRYAPSSVSAPSRTSARLLGILYLRTYVLSLILNCFYHLKTHFSVWRLMSFDGVNDYVMHLCSIIPGEAR